MYLPNCIIVTWGIVTCYYIYVEHISSSYIRIQILSRYGGVGMQVESICKWKIKYRLSCVSRHLRWLCVTMALVSIDDTNNRTNRNKSGQVTSYLDKYFLLCQRSRTQYLKLRCSIYKKFTRDEFAITFWWNEGTMFII